MQPQCTAVLAFCTTANMRIQPDSTIFLELMAKAGIRIVEALKIRPVDVKDQKTTLSESKNGKESEIVVISPKIADRLRKLPM
jgi:hypothetical protein